MSNKYVSSLTLAGPHVNFCACVSVANLGDFDKHKQLLLVCGIWISISKKKKRIQTKHDMKTKTGFSSKTKKNGGGSPLQDKSQVYHVHRKEDPQVMLAGS